MVEDARALKLIKVTHIKIRSHCRVRKKKVANRCYHSLGFGHMVADCRGLDKSRNCFWYGNEGHTAGRNCNATSAPKEKTSPGMTIFREK